MSISLLQVTHREEQDDDCGGDDDSSKCRDDDIATQPSSEQGRGKEQEQTQGQGRAQLGNINIDNDIDIDIDQHVWLSKDIVFNQPKTVFQMLLHTDRDNDIADGHPANSLISSVHAQLVSTKVGR